MQYNRLLIFRTLMCFAFLVSLLMEYNSAVSLIESIVIFIFKYLEISV